MVALTWGDVDLGTCRVHVRRRLYRGRFDAPKSKYGRRHVPLAAMLARSLWRLRGTAADEAPVFASETGGYLDPSNVAARMFEPAAEAAGVPWASFHTLRHTCATMLFRKGVNAKQAQVWLGHHSPAFTLATYTHLLPEDMPDPSLLDDLTSNRGNTEATRPAQTGRDEATVEVPQTRMVPTVPRLPETAAGSS